MKEGLKKLLKSIGNMKEEQKELLKYIGYFFLLILLCYPPAYGYAVAARPENRIMLMWPMFVMLVIATVEMLIVHGVYYIIEKRRERHENKNNHQQSNDD
ncbi:MAG TPA: hypothetical protein PLZ08_02200 [Bacillota bacterium]|jgi:hypothetical protein|nr:hypothetical protein [Bacillota bacterium]HOL09077.1 hypothetical protein [Bacillota bacterium]HPO96752.1 hypothetical protein [Bacillota bacterium]